MSWLEDVEEKLSWQIDATTGQTVTPALVSDYDGRPAVDMQYPASSLADCVQHCCENGHCTGIVWTDDGKGMMAGLGSMHPDAPTTCSIFYSIDLSNATMEGPTEDEIMYFAEEMGGAAPPERFTYLLADGYAQNCPEVTTPPGLPKLFSGVTQVFEWASPITQMAMMLGDSPYFATIYGEDMGKPDCVKHCCVETNKTCTAIVQQYGVDFACMVLYDMGEPMPPMHRTPMTTHLLSKDYKEQAC